MAYLLLLSNYNCLLLLTTLEYASKRKKKKIRALVIGQKFSIYVYLPTNIENIYLWSPKGHP